jgi:hypothetical protein
MLSEATPTVWFSPVEPLHPFLIERRNRSPVLDELFSLPFAEHDLADAILNVAYGEAVVSGPERAEARQFIADLAQLTRILEHPVALKFILPIMLVRVKGGELRAQRADGAAPSAGEAMREEAAGASP